jgi:excisionase family DNA binding protein
MSIAKLLCEVPFPEDRLNRKEAASYLGVALVTLAQDVSEKRLNVPFYRVGKKVFYRRTELEVWLESRRGNNLRSIWGGE